VVFEVHLDLEVAAVDHVAVDDLALGDALTVQVGAVRALQVVDLVDPSGVRDLGVSP